MKLEVISFNDCKKINPDKKDYIITTSISKTWSKGLSPFILGPCKLYDDFVAKNVENAWQYSKCYSEHVKDGIPTQDYFDWAINGWNDGRGQRYPMGKGRKPEFSYWDGQKLNYVEARKKIYIPVYYKAVKDTEAFAYLQSTYDQHVRDDKDFYLIDFDAYRHKELGMTYKDVVNDYNKKMGHAFVLAMMLEDSKELSEYTPIFYYN